MIGNYSPAGQSLLSVLSVSSKKKSIYGIVDPFSNGKPVKYTAVSELHQELSFPGGKNFTELYKTYLGQNGLEGGKLLVFVGREQWLPIGPIDRVRKDLGHHLAFIPINLKSLSWKGYFKSTSEWLDLLKVCADQYYRAITLFHDYCDSIGQKDVKLIIPLPSMETGYKVSHSSWVVAMVMARYQKQYGSTSVIGNIILHCDHVDLLEESLLQLGLLGSQPCHINLGSGFEVTKASAHLGFSVEACEKLAQYVLNLAFQDTRVIPNEYNFFGKEEPCALFDQVIGECDSFHGVGSKSFRTFLSQEHNILFTKKIASIQSYRALADFLGEMRILLQKDSVPTGYGESLKSEARLRFLRPVVEGFKKLKMTPAYSDFIMYLFRLNSILTAYEIAMSPSLLVVEVSAEKKPRAGTPEKLQVYMPKSNPVAIPSCQQKEDPLYSRSLGSVSDSEVSLSGGSSSGSDSSRRGSISSEKTKKKSAFSPVSPGSLRQSKSEILVREIALPVTPASSPDRKKVVNIMTMTTPFLGQFVSAGLERDSLHYASPSDSPLSHYS